MKTTRITIVFLAVTILVLATAPLASAKPIFDQQWWQGTFTFKGYRYTTDTGNALGDHMNGTIKVWLYTSWSGSPSVLNVFVCGIMRPYDPDDWGWETSTINPTDMYFGGLGASSLWNFDNGTGLLVTAIPYNITAYPVLMVKARAETQGNMSTVSCTAHAYDAALETSVLGSCMLNAATIDASRVSTRVPQSCLDQLP